MVMVMIVPAVMAFAVPLFCVVACVNSRAGRGTDTRADDRAFAPSELGTDGAADRTAHSAADRRIDRQIARRGERRGERDGQYCSVS
jgi:hypothetical protein